MQNNNYHVHFGAGRLGLGLVVPLLRHYAKDVPLAIFQRPRNHAEGDELVCESMTLAVNEDTVMKFKCITSHTEDPDVHALLDQRVPLFVSTSDVNILEAILSRTSSFSTSVGPCGFADVIEGLEIAERARLSDNTPRRVYLFENDSERFKKQIEDRFDDEQYDVIQVICDRICTHRNIAKDRVNVRCEKFTGMAVIYPSKRSADDFAPFKQICHDLNASPSKNRRTLPNLILTRTIEEAQFYYQRKLSLLNGTHFTMALLAYNTLRDKGHSQHQWASKNLAEWKSDITNHRAVRMAMQGRILRLLYSTPTKILEIVHGTDNIAEIYLMTLDYVKTTMSRIESTPDTLGRVLNLNDEKNIRIKHIRYVADVHAWLKENDKVQQECQNITGSHYDDIIDTFHSLSEKFESICTTPQEAA